MSKHETVKPARATTPQREALRAAIQRKVDLLAKIEKLEGVLSAETQKKYAAAEAVDRAQAALLLAKQNESGDNVARALGEPAISELTVLAAQRALEHAQADWKALHALCEGISERIEAERKSFQYVEKAVDDAIREVISASPEGQRVVEIYCKALDDFAVRKDVARRLYFLDARPPCEGDQPPH